MQLGHQLLANIEMINKVVEGQQVEAARLKEMALEAVGLREALERERQTSTEQKAALEEMVRRAEAETANMAEQIPTLVSEARGQVVEEFKASTEMKKLKVEFGQAAFNKGFELCQEKMVMKFSELDLSFLDEVSENEAGPSTAVATTADHLPEVPSFPIDPEVRDL